MALPGIFGVGSKNTSMCFLVAILTENTARNSPGTSETARAKMPIKTGYLYSHN
jgi:hypothetical protein